MEEEEEFVREKEYVDYDDLNSNNNENDEDIWNKMKIIILYK